MRYSNDILKRAIVFCRPIREQDRKILVESMREKIRDLTTNFPRLWHDPGTPQRERKRMVHLLVEDVTLVKFVQDAWVCVLVP